MLDRQAIDQIMQGVQSSLLDGLQSQGIGTTEDPSAGGGYMDGMDDTNDYDQKLQSWNNTDVKVPAATDRPSIWDTSKIQEPGAVHNVDQEMGGAGLNTPYFDGDRGLDDNVAPYAAAAGAK